MTLPPFSKLPHSRWRTWLLAARPATLSAAAIPVLVGTSISHQQGAVSWLGFFAALWGALWLQIAANFANDVYDTEKGADGPNRLGPPRAVQSGRLTARQMKKAVVVAIGAATLAGVFLTWHAGWPIVVMGTAAILAAVAYTGGPYPLGYHGLGDLFVMVFFGLIAVMGTVWIHLEALPVSAWWSAVAIGSLATAILVVNNVRDVEGDAAAGKRTVVVRWGRRFGQYEYLALLITAFAAPLFSVTLHNQTPWLLLPWLSAPWGAGLVVQIFAPPDGPRLNRCLKQTAALLLFFGVLLSIGFTLG